MQRFSAMGANKVLIVTIGFIYSIPYFCTLATVSENFFRFSSPFLRRSAASPAFPGNADVLLVVAHTAAAICGDRR